MVGEGGMKGLGSVVPGPGTEPGSPCCKTSFRRCEERARRSSGVRSERAGVSERSFKFFRTGNPRALDSNDKKNLGRVKVLRSREVNNNIHGLDMDCVYHTL